MIKLTDSLKTLFRETAERLKGSENRRYIAQTVKELGKGGQRLAERELGWSRNLIRKGKQEVESGITCVDAFKLRGRKSIEEKLPNLLTDIKDVVDGQSQTDPKFKTNRLYTRLSAAEVRRQLIAQKGYSSEELPSAETIRIRLNRLGYFPSKVAKTKPQKKLQ
jgi:Rhodopirellula transposase DDE domain